MEGGGGVRARIGSVWGGGGVDTPDLGKSRIEASLGNCERERSRPSAIAFCTALTAADAAASAPIIPPSPIIPPPKCCAATSACCRARGDGGGGWGVGGAT